MVEGDEEVKPFRLLSAIFAGVGLLLLAPAGMLYGLDRRFVARADRAEGVVVALEARNFQRGLKPLVEFEAEGRRIRFHESVSSTPPSRAVGDRVPVLYEKGNPDNAMVDSFWNHHLLTVIFGSIGGAFLATALGLGVAAIFRRARPSAP